MRGSAEKEERKEREVCVHTDTLTGRGVRERMRELVEDMAMLNTKTEWQRQQSVPLIVT